MECEKYTRKFNWISGAQSNQITVSHANFNPNCDCYSSLVVPQLIPKKESTVFHDLSEKLTNMLFFYFGFKPKFSYNFNCIVNCRNRTSLYTQ